MKFDDSRVDTSGLDDRRGSSGGRSRGGAGAALGGLGGLGIIGVLLALLFGGDPTTLLSQQSSGGQNQGQVQASENLAEACSTQEALQTRDDCFVLKVYNETNEVWSDAYARAGQKYPAPRLVYYSGGTVTGGCGAASASAGPFYCPADQRVYIDLVFLQQLKRQFGLQGQYATAYIVAHEVGHHLQTISGTEAQVRRAQQARPNQANQLSVAMELQADCYAGVWGRWANDRGNVEITQQEYNQALNAAAAVGDDSIMAGSGLRVNPEAFTHGSAAQRQEWFARGFNTGDPAQCNTFS